MNKYIIAIISFFDNENELHVVEAGNPIEAMKKVILSLEEINESKEYLANGLYGVNTIEDIKNFMFNMDQAISSPLQISINEFPIKTDLS